MWIFTIYGFYSVACAKSSDGAPDPDMLMIRSRTRRHLENLKTRFPDLRAEVIRSTNTDYRYRLILPRTEWVSILGTLAAEQTWSNFKNKAHDSAASCGVDYAAALHDVWSTMYRLQAKGS